MIEKIKAIEMFIIVYYLFNQEQGKKLHLAVSLD